MQKLPSASSCICVCIDKGITYVCICGVGNSPASWWWRMVAKQCQSFKVCILRTRINITFCPLSPTPAELYGAIPLTPTAHHKKQSLELFFDSLDPGAKVSLRYTHAQWINNPPTVCSGTKDSCEVSLFSRISC